VAGLAFWGQAFFWKTPQATSSVLSALTHHPELHSLLLRVASTPLSPSSHGGLLMSLSPALAFLMHLVPALFLPFQL